VIDFLRFVSGMAADLVRRRVDLVAENALLRQQLIVAERKLAGRVRWTCPWPKLDLKAFDQTVARLALSAMALKNDSGTRIAAERSVTAI